MPPVFRMFAAPTATPVRQPVNARVAPRLDREAKASVRPDHGLLLTIVAWSQLPAELLARSLAAAGPAELCRFAAVSRSWQLRLEWMRNSLDEFWQALCAEYFPSMTQKILAFQSSAVDLSLRQDKYHEREEASEEEAQEDEERQKDQEGQAEVEEEEEEGAEEDEREDEEASYERSGTIGPCVWNTSRLAAPIALKGSLCTNAKFVDRRHFTPPSRTVANERFWMVKFLQRYSRQLAWDAERQQQQRLRQQRFDLQRQQVVAEDKQRGQNFRGQLSQSDAKSQRTLRSVRVRKCRRCGVGFLPGDVTVDSCLWHRGKYCRVDDDGVIESTSSHDVRALEKAVQAAKRVSGSKKKSRQPNVLVKGNYHRCEWSCCGAESMIAAGCTSGPHT
eukprot:TRINITY_DN24364_c0_g1_i1.p1 TRINITY_DN24364_c0_g1~~TRINITY_DN24364_c0_g1_i1.p1  ORF type:complete len:411 (+),score=84.49 TRINITY_DN24364_c0_g1_i1:63-1235(+)